MKLIKCYINAYGNLHQKEIDFVTGLNSFCEDNGAGKSTLASFIRAMFYGLNATSKSYFERTRVLPFSKENCGGYLIFNFNEKEYKIERSFGKKPIEDTLTVYLNNKETNELGDVPGLIVFGYDLASFNRTIFTHSEDLNVSSTDGLNSKMGHYVEGGDDVNLEKALANLDALGKKYKPAKSADTKGLIALKEQDIHSLEEKEENLINLRASMDIKYQSRKEKQEEVETLSKQITEAAKINQVINDWAQYDKYQKEIKMTEEGLKALKDKYPAGMPSANEEEELTSLINDKNVLLIKEKNLSLDQEEEKKLASLETSFKNGLPSKEELSRLSSKIEELNVLKKTPLKELTSLESKLIKQFEGRESEIEVLDNKYRDYETLNRERLSTPSKINAASEKTPKKKTPIVLIMAIVSMMIIAAGIALGFLVNYWLFAISGFGFLLLLISAFIYLQNLAKKAQPIEAIEMDNPKRVELDKKVMPLEIDLLTSIKSFNPQIENKDDISEFYHSLKASYNNYRDIKEKERTFAKDNEEIKKSINLLEYAINARFEELGIISSGNHQKDLSAYEENLSAYLSLKQRKNNIENGRQEISLKLKSINEKIDYVVSKYHIDEPISYLKDLTKDREALRLKEESLVKAKRTLETFIKEKNLIERPKTTQTFVLEEIQAKANKASSELSFIVKDIEETEDLISKLEDEVATLPEVREELKDLKAKKKIVDITIASLKSAETSLKNMYVDPVKDGFIKYSSALEDALGKKIVMDSDFSLKIIEAGAQRDPRHLSSGELTLCSLCYRLAIIDNIFKEVKPFLIFDDLFVGLDEKHLSKAKILLNDLSKDRQIIYFTCHKSREIK